MWKDAVRALETGTLAEIGLVAFFIAFVLIVAYALTLPKRDCQDALNMPLDDGESVGAGPVGGDGR
jgi:cbb3-type cytochrome oxidase subunit 3